MDWVPVLLPISGLVAGALLGYVARRTYFCTLSALEQHWYGGNSNGLRTWVLATAFAAVFTQALVITGLLDVSQSFYLTSAFNWLGAIVGGVLFGLGMALVGTCGFGALVRLGGGSLKSLMALLVLALFALSAMRGVLALGRRSLFDPFQLDFSTYSGDQSLPSIVSTLFNADIRLLVSIVVITAMFAWVFADPAYRRRVSDILAALTIGAIVTFGWIATTLFADLSFDPVQVESASFVAPVADTLLQFTMVFGGGPDYGVGLVVGTVFGSALAARTADDVRWEACDDARELSRHILGAACMGVGGILALGCTIGQGVSAASLLTVSAPVVMVSIAVGARLGLAWMLEGSVMTVLRRS